MTREKLPNQETQIPIFVDRVVEHYFPYSPHNRPSTLNCVKCGIEINSGIYMEAGKGSTCLDCVQKTYNNNVSQKRMRETSTYEEVKRLEGMSNCACPPNSPVLHD